MRYLTLSEILNLYRRIMEQSRGTMGIRNLGAIESALVQPLMTFGGQELYPTIAEKASAIGFSLIMNHPFTDGNKRLGHAAMEVFLVMNGFEINAGIDEQEQVILRLASGLTGREEFTAWLSNHIIVKV